MVTGIVSIGGGTVRFTGRADHAGTTPMEAGEDAVVAAAQFITRLPELAPRVGAASVVTTGISARYLEGRTSSLSWRRW